MFNILPSSQNHTETYLMCNCILCFSSWRLSTTTEFTFSVVGLLLLDCKVFGMSVIFGWFRLLASFLVSSVSIKGNEIHSVVFRELFSAVLSHVQSFISYWILELRSYKPKQSCRFVMKIISDQWISAKVFKIYCSKLEFDYKSHNGVQFVLVVVQWNVWITSLWCF